MLVMILIQSTNFSDSFFIQNNIFHLRNEFHFSDIHQSMNTMGLLQSKWCPNGVTLTLHMSHFAHTLMNVKKWNSSHIYPLFLHPFWSLFVKFWCKFLYNKWRRKVINRLFRYYVQQLSPWCDVNLTLHRPINCFIYPWCCLCVV